MSLPKRTQSWLRYLRFWSNVQSDVDAELRFHLDARVAELVARGADPDAARAQTTEEFGDIGAAREALLSIDSRMARRHGRTEGIDGVKKDVAYAIRALKRT